MMVELPEQHISPPLHHVPNVYNKCAADQIETLDSEQNLGNTRGGGYYYHCKTHPK